MIGSLEMSLNRAMGGLDLKSTPGISLEDSYYIYVSKFSNTD
jgi:hypothetical protein